MAQKSPRLAVRGIIVANGRMLLVNAWPAGRSKLLCAPGGGVDPGSSMPDNLAREILEETGLRVTVGTPCLVNEFHDPRSGFHQVEVFFRCSLIGDSAIAPDWQDPERIVSEHVWAAPEDFARLHVKPDSLFAIAFGGQDVFSYDPLEPIVI